MIFKKNHKKTKVIKHLGRENYHSLLQYMGKKKNGFCVGNSSSGILEAPSLKTATINIGDRQNGRIQATSIINSNCSYNQIYNSIKKSLSIKFKRKLIFTKNPYYKKNTSKIISKIIESKINEKKTNQKKFYDIK